jgi:hypothetical protein
LVTMLITRESTASSLVNIILLIYSLPTMLCNTIGCAEEIVTEGGP